MMLPGPILLSLEFVPADLRLRIFKGALSEVPSTTPPDQAFVRGILRGIEQCIRAVALGVASYDQPFGPRPLAYSDGPDALHGKIRCQPAAFGVAHHDLLPHSLGMVGQGAHLVRCLPAPAPHTTRLLCPNQLEIGCPARRGRRRRATRTAACSLWPVSPSSSPRRSWLQTCAPLECPAPCASEQRPAQTTLGARTVRHPPSPTTRRWHRSSRCPPDTHPPCPSGRYTGARPPRCACPPSHPHSRPISACCLGPRRGSP